MFIAYGFIISTDLVLCFQRALAQGSPVPAIPPVRNCIQLGACQKNESLPMLPELPADLFTSCLTTPMKVALRW